MVRLLSSQLGVRTKFILLLLLFGLSPAVALYFILLANGDGVKNLMLDRVGTAAAQISEDLSYALRERLSDIRAFTLNGAARDPAEWESGEESTPLTEAINGYVHHYDGAYPLSVVVDPTGRIIASNTVDWEGDALSVDIPADRSFADAPWFSAVVATGRPGRSDIFVSLPLVVPEVAAITGGTGLSIVFAAPVRNDAGATIAFWINFVDFALIEAIIDETLGELEADGLRSVRVTALNRLGGVVLDRMGTSDPDGNAATVEPVDDAVRWAALGGATGAIITTGQNGNRTSAIGYAGRVRAAEAPALEWSIFVAAPLDDVLSRWNALLGSMFLAVVLSAIIIIVFGFGLGTMFTRPIRKLQEVMTTFRIDQPIPYAERRDELGAMARALASFRDDIRKAGEAAAERKATDELERLVLLRTAELARTTGFLVEHGAWLEGILTSLPIAVGLIEAPSGQIIHANAKLLELIGSPTSDGEAIDLRCYRADGSVCPPDERPTARVLRGELLRGEEIEIRHQDGLARFLSVNAGPIRDESGAITAAVLAFEDVTVKRRAAERIRHLALYDPLTDLPNRRALLADLNTALSRAASEGTDVALFLIDLDDFKTVNDIRGHQIGDRILVEAAVRLRAALRDSDRVGRLGGDEFAVIAVEFASLEELSRRADRILRGLSAELDPADASTQLKGSIGIAVSRGGSIPAEELFQMGDLALYEAKRRGGGMSCFFEPELRRRALELSAADAEIPRALPNGEFEVHYQPIIALDTMAVAAVEGLLRWRHPKRGLLTPTDFLHHVVRNRQIVPVTLHVVTEALRQLAAWRRAGMPPFRMAVNIATSALTDPALGDQIARRILAEELKGSDLILEVTEEAMNDSERTIEALRRFREMGIMVAVDDFGTGHASFARLRDIPIDLIKIDRDFMRSDPRTAAILKAMVNLSSSLDIPVVVEGAETAEHVASLKEASATYAQGYYFARPMPARDFEIWMAERAERMPSRPRLIRS
ncbi:MAG: EAL domain-containing protein [Bauldia sp.]